MFLAFTCMLSFTFFRSYVYIHIMSPHIYTLSHLHFNSLERLCAHPDIDTCTWLWVAKKPYVRSGTATQVLMVNCMVYSCGYVSNAILDGVASRAAAEDSDTSLETWQVTCQMMGIARFCCLPVAHAAIKLMGRNSCVCVLLFMSSCSLRMVSRVSSVQWKVMSKSSNEVDKNMG